MAGEQIYAPLGRRRELHWPAHRPEQSNAVYARPQGFWRIATCYAKRADSSLAILLIAAILLCLLFANTPSCAIG